MYGSSQRYRVQGLLFGLESGLGLGKIAGEFRLTLGLGLGRLLAELLDRVGLLADRLDREVDFAVDPLLERLVLEGDLDEGVDGADIAPPKHPDRHGADERGDEGPPVAERESQNPAKITHP